MKKTLSITLGGRVFAIEEDGYQALERYLTSLRSHFSADPSVDELLQDIESSFGEKFSEKLVKGKQAVTLQDVEDVIAIMGRVEEIANEDTEPSHATPSSSPKTPEASQTPRRRLYRDTDGRLIAGVCSGIAAYFDIDPLVIRLLFLALLFANGLSLLVYVVLWIAVPAAETSLQKLEMQGKAPHLSEFQELTKEKPREDYRERLLYRIVNAPFRFVGGIFEGLRHFFSLFGSLIRVIAGAACLFFSFVFATLGTMALVVFGTNLNSRYITSDVPLAELAHNPFSFIGLTSVYLLGIIPLILLAILGMSLLRRKNQFHTTATAALIGVWILAAGGAAAAGSHIGPWMYTHLRMAEEKATATKTFSLDATDQVVVSDHLHLTVRQGSQPSLTFNGPEEELARVYVTTTKGLLTVSQSPKASNDPRVCIACTDRQVRGVLTLPTLTSLTSAENADIRIEGFSADLTLHALQNARISAQDFGRATTTTFQHLSLLAEKNAFVRLAGNVAALQVIIRDNARLDAEHLDAGRVDIQAEDNSYAEVSPLQSFSATTTHTSFIRSSTSVVSSTVSEQQNSRIFIENR